MAEPQECEVCYETKDVIAPLCCSVKLCIECITKTSRKCPMCRNEDKFIQFRSEIIKEDVHPSSIHCLQTISRYPGSYENGIYTIETYYTDDELERVFMLNDVTMFKALDEPKGYVYDIKLSDRYAKLRFAIRCILERRDRAEIERTIKIINEQNQRIIKERRKEQYKTLNCFEKILFKLFDICH